MADRITIVLTDDHALVRDGIRALLEDEADLHVIDEATNGSEAVEKIMRLQPDIAIMDIRMPTMTGLEAVANLSARQSRTRSIMLTMHDSEEYVLQSVEAGAYGYLLKDSPREEFIKAIHKVYEGEKYYSGDISRIIVNKYLENLQPVRQIETPPPSTDVALNLTKREKQIARMVIAGNSNKEIADSLEKSVRTVEAHRFNLMKKLDVKNASELALRLRGIDLTTS